ncbi:MAG: hypothetical protein HY720_29190 [Planctomycetes bacterium]|nr:hypothetical protein [Planctomycetota bacterium]
MTAAEVRTYTGASLAEALAALKSDLGRDATILRTRKVRRGGLFGLFGREVVEITARAVPRPAADPPPRPATERLVSKALDRDRAQREDRVRRDLAEIKALAHDLVLHSKEHHLSQLSEGFFSWYRRLAELGVAEATAQELLMGLAAEWRGRANPGREEVLEPLLDRFLASIRMNGPIELRAGGPTRVVLVGPPGSGKSTTLAKLASSFALQQGASVAILSLDTNRVGAAEQISAYASMLNVPLAIVREPEELPSRLAEFSARRLVLVDTRGLTEKDRAGFDRTASMLRSVEASEVHLVLPATLTPSCAEASVRLFRPFRPRSLIVTKLDEAVTGWGILDLVRRFGGGLSYVTFGQSVPEDVAAAAPESIRRVLRAVGGLD